MLVCLRLSIGNLPERSSLWALSLSLSAVNLSESAQAKMAPAQLTQIYVTAATALRTVLGHHLSILPVGSKSQRKIRRWCTSVLWNLLHSIILFPPHRVIFWAVQRMLAPNQSPTACTGSSPRWVGSSSWAVIGQWSLRVPVRYTLLRETQVSCRKTRWLDGKVLLTQF